MIAHTYTLHLRCPSCAGPLEHTTNTGMGWNNATSAACRCRACGVEIVVCVTMTVLEPTKSHGRPEQPVVRRSLPAENRVPLAPLYRAAGCETDGDLAAVLQVSRGTILRLKREGVPVTRADAFAIAIDTHPALLWPDEFYELVGSDPD